MDGDDISRLDDFEVLAERQRVIAALTRAHRQLQTAERRDDAQGDPPVDAATVNTAHAAIAALPPSAARMAAVEILLTEPEALEDDVLESCLYILREKLRAAA
jgi:hypothetical protein